MTPSLLAALAAAFAPARAAASLARGDDPGAAGEAARLVQLARAERLDALAGALAGCAPPSPRAREQAAAEERPRVAALLRVADASRRPDGLMGRLILEVEGSSPHTSHMGGSRAGPCVRPPVGRGAASAPSAAPVARRDAAR